MNARKLVSAVALLGTLCGCTDKPFPGAAPTTTRTGSVATAPPSTREARLDDRPANAPAQPSDAEVDWAEVDIPVSQQTPQLVGNANIQLAQRAAQNASLCRGWPPVRSLEEPRPYDIDELTRYSDLYFKVSGFIDPDVKVPNKNTQPGQPPTVPVPEDVKTALETARAEMYRFYARVVFTASLAGQGRLNDSQIRRRLDTAFVQLASTAYTDAEARLEDFYAKSC